MPAVPSSISIHSQAARPAGRNAGTGDLQVRKPDKTPGTGIAAPRSSPAADASPRKRHSFAIRLPVS
jgi:hypothetical protein